MDAKITKERLGQFLSYEWVKIAAVAVAVILLWMMIFSGAATDITVAQRFDVYNYIGTSVSQGFREYSSVYEKNLLSYEVIESRAMNMTEYSNDYDELMLAAVTMDEIDVLFAQDAQENSAFSYTDEAGVSHKATYLETVIYKYYPDILKIDGTDGLINVVESYLGRYYSNVSVLMESSDFSAMNKALVEADFRKNIKEEKDKRYKTEEKILEAVKKEYARIESYARALVEFKGYLSQGVIGLEERTYYLRDSVGDLFKVTSKASINLCVDESITDLTDLVYYEVEEGETTRKSSKNVHLVLFKQPEGLERFTGDQLLFVNEVVRNALVTK